MQDQIDPDKSTAEPVSWQSRFVADGDSGWRPCSREHHEWVQSNPAEFQGYETRALLAAPSSGGDA